MKYLKQVLLLVVILATVEAHQPQLEQGNCATDNLIDCASEVMDPTYASSAIYGSLSEPGQVDVYKFTPQLTESIPVEALVPVRHSNREFRPAIVIFGQNLSGIQPVQTAAAVPAGEHGHSGLEFELPAGYQYHLIPAPTGERPVFFEPYSLEKLWHGNPEQITVQAGQTYFVAVFSPRSQMGDYSLGLGIKENFEKARYANLLANIVQLKLGLATGRTTHALDFFGTLLVLLGIALGFGASVFGLVRAERTFVWAGFLGLGIATIGSFLSYHLSGLSGVAVFQIVCAVVLLICLTILFFSDRRTPNGPRSLGIVTLQTVGLLSWIVGLGLFVWHLLVLR